jgi:hypothetical protein
VRAFLSKLGAIALMVSSVGCATCQNPYDNTYAAYGSSQPRADRTYGRVGSRFAPAGGAVQVAPEPGAGLPGSLELAPEPALPAD